MRTSKEAELRCIFVDSILLNANHALIVSGASTLLSSQVISNHCDVSVRVYKHSWCAKLRVVYLVYSYWYEVDCG